MAHSITDDYQTLCETAAQHIADSIAKAVETKGHAVLGLATGSTPIGVYAELVKLYDQGKVDFSKVTTFNLDEYIADPEKLPDFTKTHPESYHQFMETHLFSKITDPANPHHLRREDNAIHIPETTVSPEDYAKIAAGDYSPLKQVCADYEKDIKKAGGIDLQLLGIGENGHLGFCEPGSDRGGRTSVVKLTDHSVKVNESLFGFAVPYAVSMGLGTINEAKELLLLANGPRKTEVLGKMGEVRSRGPLFSGVPKQDYITANIRAKQHGEKLGDRVPSIPALLVLEHPNATIITDKAAASRVTEAGLKGPTIDHAASRS